MVAAVALAAVATICFSVTDASAWPLKADMESPEPRSDINEARFRKRISLAGEWDSSLGRCTLPGTTDENRLGPGNHDRSETGTLTRLYPYRGKVFYTRNVFIPDSFSGKRLRLVMERTKPSILFVDGVELGRRNSLCVPHIYDLPEMTPGNHLISVSVDNSEGVLPRELSNSHALSESTQTDWNGIIGDFFIEARDSVCIASVQVYPDIDNMSAKVKVKILSHKDIRAEVEVSASYDSESGRISGKRTGKRREGSVGTGISRTAELCKGENILEYTVDVSDDFRLWSEFHPSVCLFNVRVGTEDCFDQMTVQSGMRDFSASGTSFTINSFKTFLRGKHDACVFPLTGYPPMDAHEWQKIFSIARQYGINHYRFHSWIPPRAAFDAADKEGVYLQIELPLWGEVARKNTELNSYLLEEGRRAVEEYGNHPSFVMMSLGNELHGDTSLMREWVDTLRSLDSRHLYCFGSNNSLGWDGPQEGEDFFVACRVGWGEGYSSQVRTTFAYVDAEKGGILNNTRPGTAGNYASAIAKSPIPVISHENCQFQSYPDFTQIDKYKGVLYPYNLEIFRDRLEKNGMSGQAETFSNASGKFAAECYKADLEYAFRTPGFGGFQMLDLQDYPGQGTALVGLLDAFMDSKGVISPEEFRSSCAPVVLLASFNDYCLTAADDLNACISVAAYEENDFVQPLSWSVRIEEVRSMSSGTVNPEDYLPSEMFKSGFPVLASGRFYAKVAQGQVSKVGEISVPLSSLPDYGMSYTLILHLESGGYSNDYRFWVYPDGRRLEGKANLSWRHDIENKGVMVSDRLDGEMQELLESGKSVLLLPDMKTVEENTAGGLFTPDFWNWTMFRTISENAGKEVSPGTLSVLNDPNHPLFNGFPCRGYSQWQWWSITRNSRPLILDDLQDYVPVVQVIDNVERAHKLGIVSEFSVGKGKLMICMTDLDALAGTPEGDAFLASLVRYLSSEDFHPSYKVTIEELCRILYSDRQEIHMKGVRNETDYSDKKSNSF